MKQKNNNKRRKTVKRVRFTRLQITMISIIAICFVLVISYLIYSLANLPEKRIPRLIEQFSRDYYENYLYKGLSESEYFKNDPEKTMEQYEKYGFTAVKLRTLLLYDEQKNHKYADYIREYCNENSTSVKFYPEAPYGKGDYNVQYTYSCEF